MGLQMKKPIHDVRNVASALDSSNRAAAPRKAWNCPKLRKLAASDAANGGGATPDAPTTS